MKDYKYEIKLQAETKEEAVNKMTAVCTLLTKLTEKELSKLAYVVEYDPIKTKMAKIALGV
jgi:hypothetical protein